MSKSVVVDSDSIFAIYNPDDPLNTSAVETFKKLIDQGYELIYPSSVIFEVISLFQRVSPKPIVTALLKEKIQNDELRICYVDAEILKESVLLFKPVGSKKNTLVDCSVVVVAKKLGVGGVFSYDEFYGKNGLKSATKLVETSNIS